MTSFPNNWTEEDVADRAKRRVGIQDQCILSKEFEYDGYFVEMTIFNDNNATNKWGRRGIFGWIDIHRENKDTTCQPIAKLGYSITVVLNDWDLSPRYVEHGLLGKLEMYIQQQKDLDKENDEEVNTG